MSLDENGIAVSLTCSSEICDVGGGGGVGGGVA